MTSKNRITALTFVLAFIASILIPAAPVSALSGSDFQAAKIISDSVFFTPGSMTQADIQTFLNSKVPTCDTNGQQTIYDPTYNDTVTRQLYSSRRGVSTPFTCLKDYSQSVNGTAADPGLCNAISSGVKSSAQIIYEVAQACSVNSRVLLTLLQKEQNLVTDDWPWPVEYRSATGYGCPDTASCDATYYGFYNQVYMAAWQFKKYAQSPSSYGYIANRNNTIQYNPDATCGGSNVLIQDQATAGLYNYTPYQPNAAALANLYGNGDACSSYGNRNFWRFYNDWFGSTQVELPYAWVTSTNTVYADSARTQPYSPGPTVSVAPGGKVYVSLSALNIGNQTWSQSTTFLGTTNAQDRSSVFADSSWTNPARIPLQETSVGPSNLGTFKFSMSAPSTPGSYYECFNMVVEGVTWLTGPTTCYSIDVVVPQDPNTDNIQLQPGQSISPGNYLMSSNTHSMLMLQSDGNVVLYSDSVPMWQSHTNGTAAKSLVMQTDGNLVLYSQTGQALWASTTPSNPNAHAILQSDGNFVIYSSANAPLWATGTTHTPSFSGIVLHSMKGGVLYPRQSLQMANRSHVLLMQDDGNLVLYSGTKPVWASWTQNNPGAYAVVQSDGNFVIYSKSQKPLWATFTMNNPSANLILQDDGNLVLYSNSTRPLWHTHTYGL